MKLQLELSRKFSEILNQKDFQKLKRVKQKRKFEMPVCLIQKLTNEKRVKKRGKEKTLRKHFFLTLNLLERFSFSEK